MKNQTNKRKKLVFRVVATIFLITAVLAGFCRPSTTWAKDPKKAAYTKTEKTKTEKTKTAKKQETKSDSTFSIQYIDVGQADAALVECDGHYMLIDGGNKRDSRVIYTILKNKEVKKLDIVVGTHAHEDHIGGIPGAFNYATADLTLCPVTEYDSEAFEDFKKYADKNGGGITVPEVDDSYELGSAKVDILGVNSGEENDTSIVLKITYGKTSFLFTGDAEQEAEQTMIDDEEDLSATVLKVGHHGSDNSTSDKFLKEVDPKYAIISVGKDNAYGHPTEEVLDKLKDSKIKIYRTDLNGDISLKSDGKKVTISTEKKVSKKAAMASGKHKKQKTSPKESATMKKQTENQEKNTVTGTDYIINTNTGKFHYTDCKSVKMMKEHNKSYFTGNRDELINKGYSPCGNCNP